MTPSVPSFTTIQPDLSLAHLQAELGRIDILIHREVRRWQLAGQDPSDAFRGQYISDAEAGALLQRPLATGWGQTVTLPPEEAKAYETALAQVQQETEALVKTARAEEHPLRLTHLAQVFGLTPFELDALLICLAPTLDLKYERLYGYLQDDVTRKRPTVNLTLNLLCQPGPARLLKLPHFADDAPLIKHHLLERLPETGAGKPSPLTQTLLVDESLIAWLLGGYRPHALLKSQVTLHSPASNRSQEPAPQGRIDIAPLLKNQPLLIFWGADRLRQEKAAGLLAAQANRKLLAVDLTAIIEQDIPAPTALQLALRDAQLTHAIPCLQGWDACLQEHKTSPDLLALLCNHPDAVIVMGKARWYPEGIERERKMFWFEFPLPSFAERKTLWTQFLGTKAAENELDLDDIVGQFALTSGQIRDIVASARDRAAQQQRPLHSDDILAAARAHSSTNLVKLARKIEPRYTWTDIILPDDQTALLKEVVATLRARPKVLDEWQVSKKLVSSAGVTALFAGPPGTGKTMAAEVIAGELGLDLYKIDLSTVISKYVGETEKNLEKIFTEAERSNAILFFDEADSIFGKRSEVRDAHDRYANIEVSYLLQRMEAYDGVTILATNLRANLDEAFIRRLQFAVDFPFPEQPEERLRIWETFFPATVPRAADVDLPLMARRFKLAGGNIRNIIVSAAYLAAADGGQVTMAHLLHGSRRELQKMGRLVNQTDLNY